MPSGRIHTKIDVLVLAIIIGFSLYSRGYLLERFDKNRLLTYSVAFVCSYLFSTVFLSPDLDLDRCRSLSNWGFLRFLWYPYARVFRHRGVSHSLVFGTLTRVVYLGLVIAVVSLTLGLVFDIEVKVPFHNIDTKLALVILAGLYLPDALHITADRVFRDKS